MTPAKGDALSRLLFGIARKPVPSAFPSSDSAASPMRRHLAAKKLHAKLHRRHEHGSRNEKGRFVHLVIT
jgi:hypothetical protein